MKRKTLFVTAAVALVAAFVVGTLVYQSQKADSAQALARQAHLARDYAPTAGPAEAKVHIVEFLDPACETCRSFYPFVKRMMAANPGKIRVSVRYAPFHKQLGLRREGARGHAQAGQVLGSARGPARNPVGAGRRTTRRIRTSSGASSKASGWTSSASGRT